MPVRTLRSKRRGGAELELCVVVHTADVTVGRARYTMLRAAHLPRRGFANLRQGQPSLLDQRVKRCESVDSIEHIKRAHCNVTPHVHPTVDICRVQPLRRDCEVPTERVCQHHQQRELEVGIHSGGDQHARDGTKCRRGGVDGSVHTPIAVF